MCHEAEASAANAAATKAEANAVATAVAAAAAVGACPVEHDVPLIPKPQGLAGDNYCLI